MKTDTPQTKVCLATATTADYLPGTLVTVGSFLKHHPDLDGDVVIIHDGLDERQRAYLGALSDRVRFLPVSVELRERIARVGAAVPRVAPILSRLYAFEAYRLTGYSKLLVCDGDLLFRQPIGELFASEDALLCCGESAYLRGLSRDLTTFALLDASLPSPPAGTFDRPFNSGLLLIDARLTGEGCYADLLSLVTPDTWRGTDDTPTIDDQFLSNRYFHGRHTLIGSTYNFMLRHTGLIMAREGLSPVDAKVLHFNLPVKPWMPANMLRWTCGPAPVPVFDFWYDAWTECLAAAHLRTARRIDRAARGK